MKASLPLIAAAFSLAACSPGTPADPADLSSLDAGRAPGAGTDDPRGRNHGPPVLVWRLRRQGCAAGEDRGPGTGCFAKINYGPWDRLAGNRPFIPGYGDKPLGANFYPVDMSREEFEAWDEPARPGSIPTCGATRRAGCRSCPTPSCTATSSSEAAGLLREAAKLVGNEALAHYLELRAAALVTDEYQPSDMAWMDMKDNRIELVIGPIETYEDRLFGYRASFEAFVLIKDLSWSERLARFAAFLPELQRGLPVPDEYKAERPAPTPTSTPTTPSITPGDANAGSKTIAINLPNDEQVQLEKGTRRLQLRNSMQAKFDQILVPIAEYLIAEDLQSPHHLPRLLLQCHVPRGGPRPRHQEHPRRPRHGPRGPARAHGSALEEAKADVLGLYMITELFDRNELHEGEILDHYVTFLAGLFRSVRFGASSAHGRANMIQFNHFSERGAFERGTDGRYRVNFERMREAVRELAGQILVLQGDGDHAGAGALLGSHGVIRAELADDLERINAAGIPVDVVFEQGLDVVGLR
jgi:hypothetical protein